jgi:hypothetical protein
VSSSDTEIYYIIGSLPNYFEEIDQEFQLFPYQIKISNVILDISGFRTTNFIKAYPNPVENILRVELETYEHKIEIELYSIIGHKIFAETYFNKKEIEIDFSYLNEGVNFLKVSTNKKSIIFKLLKK